MWVSQKAGDRGVRPLTGHCSAGIRSTGVTWKEGDRWKHGNTHIQPALIIKALEVVLLFFFPQFYSGFAG